MGLPDSVLAITGVTVIAADAVYVMQLNMVFLVRAMYMSRPDGNCHVLLAVTPALAILCVMSDHVLVTVNVMDMPVVLVMVLAMDIRAAPVIPLAMDILLAPVIPLVMVIRAVHVILHVMGILAVHVIILAICIIMPL